MATSKSELLVDGFLYACPKGGNLVHVLPRPLPSGAVALCGYAPKRYHSQTVDGLAAYGWYSLPDGPGERRRCRHCLEKEQELVAANKVRRR